MNEAISIQQRSYGSLSLVPPSTVILPPEYLLGTLHTLPNHCAPEVFNHTRTNHTVPYHTIPHHTIPYHRAIPLEYSIDAHPLVTKGKTAPDFRFTVLNVDQHQPPNFVIEKIMSAAVAHRHSPRLQLSASTTHSPMDKSTKRIVVKSEGW